ncbi:hypothetical protein TNCV_2113491 [Trichonephila clavipes]|nr:hypothetical protein TNCV_2113491 [Trichonephila clavipes]
MHAYDFHIQKIYQHPTGSNLRPLAREAGTLPHRHQADIMENFYWHQDLNSQPDKVDCEYSMYYVINMSSKLCGCGNFLATATI